jgi:deoxyribonuclease-4
VRLGCDCFQIFARNPRGWSARPLDKCEVSEFRSAREAAGLWPLVIHSVYLINLAAQEPGLLARSRQTFREEVIRALALGAEYLVVHAGSPVSEPSDVGIETAVESIRESVRGVKLHGATAGSNSSGASSRLTILIENSAGQGASIGSTFEEIAEMLARLEDLPIGVCLDTAHAFASGYDLSTEPGMKAMTDSVASSFGLERIRLIHCNDSKAPLGSRVDRHQHLGLGFIGSQALRRFTRASEWEGRPFILETPIDKSHDDKWNLRQLRRLSGLRRAKVRSSRR